MAPVIIAKDLYKCYAGFSPVLRGVNIEVEAGELVAIMGPMSWNSTGSRQPLSGGATWAS